MPKKSILYIITKSVWGGVAKYVYDLTTHLPKDRFAIFVAAGGQEEFTQRINKANIPYFEIKNFQRRISIFKDLLAGWEIFRLLLKLKPDIVHVNSSKAGGITGLVAAIYKTLSGHQLQLIFTAHGWAFSEDRPQRQLSLIKFFSKITALFYDKIICVSEYDKKIALANKITPANKLITIHNGLDLQKLSFYDRQRAQIKLLNKTSSYVVGTIAEWTKNKGIFYLLQAIAKIKPANKFEVVLIGSGENPDKEKISAFIKNYNLKNIHLHEWLPNAASYLKAFDVFVLPSVKEGLPYTILEAMAAQVPIVATQVGGIPEMLSSNALIESKNSQKLAEKIIYLLNNPELLSQMTKKAREKLAKEFSLETMIRETIKLYK